MVFKPLFVDAMAEELPAGPPPTTRTSHFNSFVIYHSHPFGQHFKQTFKQLVVAALSPLGSEVFFFHINLL